jgi:hypothetical protein
VRQSLWDYVFKKLQQTPMPDGRTLYFEYDAESAWEFRGGESGQRNPRTAHNHGESDPSAAFWLEFLCFHSREGKTAIVKSKDGDEVCILLYALELQEKHAPSDFVRKPVYWQSQHDAIYDMRAYLELVTKKYKMTASQYMIFCILCGTDFFEKKLICNQFGMQKIFEAFRTVKEQFAEWGTPLPEPQGQTEGELAGARKVIADQRLKEDKHALMVFIRQLYQVHFKGAGAGDVLERNKTDPLDKVGGLLSYEALKRISDQNCMKRAAADKVARIAVPEMHKIEQAYTDIKWNFDYWRDRSRYPKGMHGTGARASEEFLLSSKPPAAAAAAAASSSPGAPTPPPSPRKRSAEEARIEADLQSPLRNVKARPSVQLPAELFPGFKAAAAAEQEEEGTGMAEEEQAVLSSESSASAALLVSSPFFRPKASHEANKQAAARLVEKLDEAARTFDLKASAVPEDAAEQASFLRRLQSPFPKCHHL